MAFLILFFVLTFTFYAFLIWFLDRYEKEPLRNVLAVLLWSVFFAPAGSLFLHLGASGVLSALFPFSQTLRDYASALVAAPFIEESFKGIILLFPFIRKQIDSYLDGAYYGALAGLGFAFTEDFLYVLSAYYEGGTEDAVALFVVRSIFLGMNHAFFTSITGIGIAYFVLKRWYIMPFLGWAGAVFFHALHNTIASPGTVAGLLIATGWHWVSGTVLLAIILSFVYHEKKILQQTGSEWSDDVGPLNRLFTGFFSRFDYIRRNLYQGGLLSALKARRQYNAYAHFLLAWKKATSLRDRKRMNELLIQAQTLHLRYLKNLSDLFSDLVPPAKKA